MRHGDWAVVAGALAAAVALRLVFVAETAGHPLYQALTGDPALYYAQARDILAGSPVPDQAYFHSSPLYPFFLAALLRTFGDSLTAVRLAQAAVGVVSVLLVTLLARTAFGRRAALVTAWLAARTRSARGG